MNLRSLQTFSVGSSFCLLLLFCSGINAQTPEQIPTLQVIAAEQAKQARFRIDKSVEALKSFFAQNQNLPSTAADMDKFLLSNFERIRSSTLPDGSSVQAEGIYRKLPGLKICCDPQVTSLNKINNEWQFPANWNAEPNDIVITTDGGKSYVVWNADAGGKVGSFYQVGKIDTPQPQ